MGFRFRRSLKIAPGVRVNLGLTGASLSVGPRGASVTVGKRGVYSNVGLPGTGMSLRSRLDGGGGRARSQARFDRLAEREARIAEQQRVLAEVSIALNDDGSLKISDSYGSELPAAMTRALWQQKGEAIRDWLEETAADINGDVELLTGIHLDTPSPADHPILNRVPFQETPPPRPPAPRFPSEPKMDLVAPLGVLGGLIPGAKRKHEQRFLDAEQRNRDAMENWKHQIARLEAEHDDALAKWETNVAAVKARERAHEQAEDAKQQQFQSDLHVVLDVMESALEVALSGLVWPRETLVSYEISDSGSVVWLDVDLPEIEDLPQRVAAVAASGRKLNIKDKAQKQLRGEYATHVHGIGFRLIGTVLATLPAVSHVVLSGFSQRLDAATGQVNDEYLYSVRASRDAFSRIDFDHLDRVDPIEAIGGFEVVRKMTKTGVFSAIEPYGRGDAA